MTLIMPQLTDYQQRAFDFFGDGRGKILIIKAPTVAIDAIKEQNKMAGITGGNVVAVKTNDDGTAEFVVKFGG